MSKTFWKNGQTSIILRVRIPDTTSVIGGGKTGLAFGSAGLIIAVIADVEASATVYTQAGSTIETITTLGTFAAPTATKCRFKEVDATNFPGLYEIQIADARWAVSGARCVIVSLPPVSGLGTGPVWAEVQLTAVDPQDATRGGMTSLPNASAEAAGGLYTRGTGAGQINQPGNGLIDTSLKAILNTALTETPGQIAAAFKQFFNIASPTSTMNTITTVTNATNLTTNNDKTGYALSAAGVQAIWDALTSALTTVGSIGKLIKDYLDAAISTRLASSAIIVDSGMAQAGSANAITLESGSSTVDNFYNGMTIHLTGGMGAGQRQTIASYVGATRIATLGGNWATNPDNTSTYDLLDLGGGSAGSVDTATFSGAAKTEVDTILGFASRIGAATLTFNAPGLDGMSGGLVIGRSYKVAYGNQLAFTISNLAVGLLDAGITTEWRIKLASGDVTFAGVAVTSDSGYVEIDQADTADWKAGLSAATEFVVLDGTDQVHVVNGKIAIASGVGG